MYRLYHQTNSPYTMSSGVNMSKISLLPIFVAGATLPVIKRTAQSSGRDTSNLCRPFRGRATKPSTS